MLDQPKAARALAMKADNDLSLSAFYHLTKDVFPAVYFSQMLKGNWYGPKGLFVSITSSSCSLLGVPLLDQASFTDNQHQPPQFVPS